MPRTNKIALVFAKFLITAGLIYWLYSHADSARIGESLTSIGATQIITAVGLHLVAFLLGSVRWWLLLNHAVESMPFGKVFPSYYLGVFFNNLLPTSMGGDAVRSIHLGLRGISIKALSGSAIMDRAIGLLAVLGMGIASIGIAREIMLDARDRILLAATTTIVLLGITLLFNTRFMGFIQRLAAKYHHTRIRRFLLETWQLCHSYKSAGGRLLVAMAITIVMQSAIILSYSILGEDIGISLPLITYFGIIPVVFLASALPVSLGGLGVREGTLVGLLVALGIDTQLAISLSLLYLFVYLLSSLPGGLVLLLSRKGKIAPS